MASISSRIMSWSPLGTNIRRYRFFLGNKSHSSFKFDNCQKVDYEWTYAYVSPVTRRGQNWQQRLPDKFQMTGISDIVYPRVAAYFMMTFIFHDANQIWADIPWTSRTRAAMGAIDKVLARRCPSRKMRLPENNEWIVKMAILWDPVAYLKQKVIRNVRLILMHR